MYKLFLLLSFSLIAPVCQAMDLKSALKKEKSAKTVSFAQEKEVRTFKKDSKVDTFVEQKKVAMPVLKPSMQARIGNSLLGVAMIWAGIYAVPTAIRNPGENAFFRAVSIGAFVCGVAITLAGFKKIEGAVRG